METLDPRSSNCLSDPSSSATYPCLDCGMVFSRNDHLKRHAQLHAGERPFACPKCERRFSRSDTLQRHMIIHYPERRLDENEPHPGETDRSHHKVRKQARKGSSCAACRQSKQRCDGGVPCYRCERHSRPCHYPPKRSRQRKPENRTSPQNKADGSISEVASDVDVDAALAQAVRRSDGMHSTMERVQALDLVRSTRNDDSAMMDEVFGISSSSTLPGSSDYATNERPPLSISFDSPWPWFWQGIGSSDGLPVSSHGQVSMDESQFPHHDARGRQDGIIAGTQSLASHLPCTVTSVDQLSFPTAASHSSILCDNRSVKPGQDGNSIPGETNSRSRMPSLYPSIGSDRLKGPDTGSRREAPDGEAHAGVCDTNDKHSHVSITGGVSDDDLNPTSEAFSRTKGLSQRAYSDLCLWINAPWVTDALLSGPSQGRKSLPDQSSMNSFLRLYFEKFHQLLPIIHQPTFDPNSAPTLLVLAMACIGSHYSDTPEAAKFAKEIVDALGGVISQMVDDDEEDVGHVWFGQSAILVQVALSFTCKRPLSEKAHYTRGTLNFIGRKLDCFGKPSTAPNLSCTRQSNAEDSWASWIKWEAHKRVAYGIWLLDSQLRLFFNLQPFVPVEWLQFPLPCHESLWEAADAANWLKQYRPPEPKTIRQELENFYRGTDVVKDLGQFSFLLVLLGHFRDHLFLRQACDDGLSTILNCDGRPVVGQSDLLRDEEFWEMLNPARRPRPGPIMMERLLSQHYHAVGILLRFRYDDLLAFSGWRVSKSKEVETRMRLSTWVLRNGEHARIAASHAARLFGTMRHHPTHGYHEAPSVFLASLSLWVYSMSDSRSLLGPFGRCLQPRCWSLKNSEEITKTAPINIDEESDVKITRKWVSKGCHIPGSLEGVGSLYEPEFTTRILSQGIRLIATLNCWEVGGTLADMLRTHQVQ